MEICLAALLLGCVQQELTHLCAIATLQYAVHDEERNMSNDRKSRGSICSHIADGCGLQMAQLKVQKNRCVRLIQAFMSEAAAVNQVRDAANLVTPAGEFLLMHGCCCNTPANTTIRNGTESCM